MHHLQTGSGVAGRQGLSDLPDLVEVGANRRYIIKKQLAELVWGGRSGGFYHTRKAAFGMVSHCRI